MNYTSIEQSKKLIELGLSLNISDMIYPCLDVKSNLYDKPIVRESLLHAMHTTIECKSNDIPCWSVGALLEVIPQYRIHAPYPGEDNYICWSTHSDLIDMEFAGKSLIEASYNMVVWLLENNYIKQ